MNVLVLFLFVADHVTCFQISRYSLWTSLTGVVRSGVDEMNGTPTSQCDFMTDLAADRLWCGITFTDRTLLHTVHGGSLGSATETTDTHCRPVI